MLKGGGMNIHKSLHVSSTQTFFTYDVGKNDKTIHNAPFPEQLAEDHVISWSNPGDLVLDPFVGSGTTGKMAVLNERDFIGIDISPEYCELARTRIGGVPPKDLGS